jgi:hypothetical protein
LNCIFFAHMLTVASVLPTLLRLLPSLHGPQRPHYAARRNGVCSAMPTSCRNVHPIDPVAM